MKGIKLRIGTETQRHKSTKVETSPKKNGDAIKLIIFFFLMTALLIAFGGRVVGAENIDPENEGAQYTYGENTGWLNLEPAASEGVSVDSEKMTGYVWAENIGWVNLSPADTAGVVNDECGNVSGYAWGENVGWINFAPPEGGVFINEDGNFCGFAWGENIGWINFQGASAVTYKVRTDYLPDLQVSVPNDFATVQGAIDAACTRQIIIVDPGLYKENIDFKGKGICLKSTDPNDPEVVAATIIDGDQAGSVVSFTHGESEDSLLYGLTIQNGHAVNGGGIYGDGNSCPTIRNCLIMNNSATSEGGGIHCGGGSRMSISNCTVVDNAAGADGGGIYCRNQSLAKITNCVIAKNVAPQKGGGICCISESSATITNCTISGNYADSGGGVYGDNSWPLITNCILRHNGPDEVYPNDGTIPVTYSNVENGYGDQATTHNIDTDPLFVDPNVGNYYLQEGSSCINTGTSTNAPLQDKEGFSRRGEVDMGAFEHIAPASCTPRASFFPDQTNGVDTLTVLFDASSSGASQYTGVSFQWDFGDGQSQSGDVPTVSHTYAYGTFKVSLLLTTTCGSHRLTFDNLLKVETSFYHDADNDGFGDPYDFVTGSDIPSGYVTNNGDCNDGNSSINPNALEVCDGIDNDCDASTPDGAAAAWLSDACDGPDADLCNEGVYECASGTKTCTDNTEDNLEVCDGIDNDCDASTPDGAVEAWLSDACDGPDADLCNEGVYECASGTKTCTDNTEDNLEVCDGFDNDCDGIIPSEEIIEADFSADVIRDCAPCTVSFSDLSTNNPIQWMWYFGDGNSAAEQSPVYTYNQPGDYTVSLEVSNGCGRGTETKEVYITVTTGPAADFSAFPSVGPAPLTVKFKDKSSTDTLSREWDFGDGTDHVTEQDPNHMYQKEGVYEVRLTVSNGDCTREKVKIIRAFANNTISGSVYDEMTQQGIDKAAILAVGPISYETQTDENGAYILKNLPYGIYTLQICALAHETKFEEIKNEPGVENLPDIYLSSATGRISGKVLHYLNPNQPSLGPDPDNPIPGATVAAHPVEDNLYSRVALTDPNGLYAIYLSQPENYTLIASKRGYIPEIDSNQGVGYTIADADSFIEVSEIMLQKEKGPLISVSSYEWNAAGPNDPIDNHTTILVFSEGNYPLQDISIDRVDDSPGDVGEFAFYDNPNTMVIGDISLSPVYQAEFFQYAGSDIDTASIEITATDQTGSAALYYTFQVNPNTSSTALLPQPNAGTAGNMKLIEGGEVDGILSDTDGDGIGDAEDNSQVVVNACGIVTKKSEGYKDPNLLVADLIICLERLNITVDKAITAVYDVYLTDSEGDRISDDIQVDEDHPITIYLHFDPAAHAGNLANIAIKHLGAYGTWETDGISNVRIGNNAIIFDVIHLTPFAAFSEDIRPANLSAVTVNISQINLDWQDCSLNELLEFEIFRRVNSDPNYSLIATVAHDVTSYSDVDCSLDITYSYRVRALNQLGYTEYSNIAQATIREGDFPPAAPSDLTDVDKSGGNCFISATN